MQSARALCLLSTLFVFTFVAAPAPHLVRAAGSFNLYLPLVIGTPSTTTYYVAQGKAASDTNSGSSTAPLATIKAAIAKVAPGDTIVVGPGVYSEAISLTRIDGTASQPITLRADGAVTIQPSSGKPLRITSSYWVVQGFTITPNGRNEIAVSFEAPAHNTVVQDCHLFNGGTHGVVLDDGTTANRILNNEIDHFSAGDSDAHGVAIHESHNNIISGNHIHNNSGDSVQVFSIDTQAIAGRSANGNQILNNSMHDDRENAVDIKSSQGTVVSGNRMWGYRPSSTSDGMAIEIHYHSQDVLVASNVISDSNWGIEVSRGAKNGKPYPYTPERVTLRNNLIYNTVKVNDDNSGDGAGIVVREASNVTVWNNTLHDIAGNCLVLTWAATAHPSTVDIRNNAIVSCGEHPLFLKDTTPTNLTIDYNIYNGQDTKLLSLGSTLYTLSAWTVLTGFDAHSSTADANLSDNGLPRTGSPLIDKGTNVGLPFCGKAPDIGAFETGC